MPERDAVIAITSETPDMQKELNLVWKFLLPGMKEQKLRENPASYTELKGMLSDLELSPGTEKPDPQVAAMVSGRKYSFAHNVRNLGAISFKFAGDVCNVILTAGETDYFFSFGNGKWIKGETEKKGPNLLENARGHFAGLGPAKTACSYNWQDENTITLILRYIESPHSETYTCRFEGDSIKAALKTSFAFESEPLILRGNAVKN